MRKIENGMCAAVEARQNWMCSNTQVKVENGSVNVYLFGNKIYEKAGKFAAFTLAEHNTVTTRSRLRTLGVRVRCYNDAPQMEVNGEWVDIRSNEWYNVEG